MINERKVELLLEYLTMLNEYRLRIYYCNNHGVLSLVDRSIRDIVKEINKEVLSGYSEADPVEFLNNGEFEKFNALNAGDFLKEVEKLSQINSGDREKVLAKDIEKLKKIAEEQNTQFDILEADHLLI